VTEAQWEAVWVGLHEFYKCKRCPDAFCCTEIPVEVLPDEIITIADYLGESISQFMRLRTIKAGGKIYLKFPCPFFGSEGCRIYEVRPKVCRRYPFAPWPGVLHTNVCPLSIEIAETLLGEKLDQPKELEKLPTSEKLPKGVTNYKTYDLYIPLCQMELLLGFKKGFNKQKNR